jgi:hypothetical protein
VIVPIVNDVLDRKRYKYRPEWRLLVEFTAIIWEADTQHCFKMAPDLVQAKADFTDSQCGIEERV